DVGQLLGAACVADAIVEAQAAGRREAITAQRAVRHRGRRTLVACAARAEAGDRRPGTRLDARRSDAGNGRAHRARAAASLRRRLVADPAARGALAAAVA